MRKFIKGPIEQMVGEVRIPLGVAGPVKVNTKKLLIPLATTEKVLVASVNRGCKAITKSGGATVLTEKIGATRGPLFETGGLRQSKRFNDWLVKNFDLLDKKSKKTSQHIKLLKIEPLILGSYVFVRFNFDTDRAMGMNMATIATDEIAEYVAKKTGIKCLCLSGNYCVDKKPSWLNFINGRGIKISAEVILQKKVLKEILKTNARDFFDVWLGKCMVGSAVSGSMGFNAQYANIIAAIYLATGQDAAHIVEGSLGITTAKIIGEDLKVSVYLPDIMIGTIGGGTGLSSQKDALSIIGENNLAEGIGGAVLAAEISLLSSLSEGSLAKVHAKFRNS